ncbi:hypothetical protein [Burkholderia cenocepacia]|uniref:hypothetical protein n=1 Tax=Burkholderia cenocepacia TaxID=95486 RepID=UPI001FC875B1|nr:hypothetical protein [Burkholderia cenocepacia]
MTEKKTRGRQIHVELPSNEYDAFKAFAKKQDLSLQQLARRCIRAYMEHGDAYKDTHPNLKIIPDAVSVDEIDLPKLYEVCEITDEELNRYAVDFLACAGWPEPAQHQIENAVKLLKTDPTCVQFWVSGNYRRNSDIKLQRLYSALTTQEALFAQMIDIQERSRRKQCEDAFKDSAISFRNGRHYSYGEELTPEQLNSWTTDGFFVTKFGKTVRKEH